MKTYLHLVGSLALLALGSIETRAQLVFTATDLPSQPGQYYRAYERTNVNVSAWLGPTGGPQRWDFSQARDPNETILRMDIVATNDGGHGAGITNASYCERIKQEASGSLAWMYFRIVTNEGRLYYGFYNQPANPADPQKVFHPPTLDLPSPIQYGQSWTWATDFSDVIDVGFVFHMDVHFTVQAAVDAYGTVVLPGIGEVPALRVNEVHTYHYVDTDLGIIDVMNYFRNYYWLVRGVGKVMDITSGGSDSGVPPENFATAADVQRVFEASDCPDCPPRSVAGLQIRLQNGQATLSWQPTTNASSYRVELRRDLVTNDWQLLAEPATNAWSEAVVVAEPQRYFRVLSRP